MERVLILHVRLLENNFKLGCGQVCDILNQTNIRKGRKSVEIATGAQKHNSKLILYSLPDKGVFSYRPFNDCIDGRRACGVIIEGNLGSTDSKTEADIIPDNVKVTIIDLDAGFDCEDTASDKPNIPVSVVKRRLKIILPRDRYRLLDKT